jgi:biopolymer transport protein ExbB
MLLSLLSFNIPGGWAILPILVCSLVTVAIIIYKSLELPRSQIIPAPLEDALESVSNTPSDAALQKLQLLLREDQSVLGRICRHALKPEHASREEAARSTESVAREEVSALENWVPALEVIFTIAPMIGLMGTAVGMMQIFSEFGVDRQSAEQAAGIARGISEALICTLAGLGVAVLAYVFQTYFLRQVEKTAARMATLTSGLISVAFRPAESVVKS